MLFTYNFWPRFIAAADVKSEPEYSDCESLHSNDQSVFEGGATMECKEIIFRIRCLNAGFNVLIPRGRPIQVTTR